MSDSEINLSYLKRKVADFRDQRNWKKYHNPKDLAISISIEANELLELFQWASIEEIERKIKNDSDYLEKIKEELADVLIYCLSMADILQIDVSTAILSKIKKNEEKYPVEKFNGIYYKVKK
jgi:NTP pyrophosphatase (non-canonical NTP hydrolase)